MFLISPKIHRSAATDEMIYLEVAYSQALHIFEIVIFGLNDLNFVIDWVNIAYFAKS